MVLMILRNYGLCMFFSFLTTISPNETNGTKKIVNVTCILDEYGTGYIGTQNTTYDGFPCVEWSRNALLYKRFELRGVNISKNYCRNPDRDSEGPWCFTLDRSILRRHFKYKRCGIPLCQPKISQPKYEVYVGFKMVLKRKCPFGFIRKVVKRPLKNEIHCEVEKEFLSKLPIGKYSLKLTVPNSFNCPEGFIFTKYSSRDDMYCTRTDSTSDLIEFPRYLTPKPGDLIFVAVHYGPDTKCRRMSEETSIIIWKSKMVKISPVLLSYYDSIVTMCHYFYKLSDNRVHDSVDRKLAILVLENNCPKNWTVRSMPFAGNFTLRLKGNMKSQLVYACVPNEDIQSFPDGDYCLLRLAHDKGSNSRCPKEFIDVDMKIDGNITVKFCCTQSSQYKNSNQVLYDFFNASSLLIINSANKCEKTTNKEIVVKQYTSEALMYKKFECPNCDLFEVFFTQEYGFGRHGNYFKIQLKVCSYERAIKPGPLTNWPIGSYIFYKPYRSLCPLGFDKGAIIIQSFYNINQKFMNPLMLGTWDENYSIYSYCKRNSSVVDKLRPAEYWPPGNYCLIFEKKCPPGMLRLRTSCFGNSTPKKQIGAQITGWPNLCCQQEKLANQSTLPYFPGDYYSFIIQPTSDPRACPPHQNARAALVDMRTEILCIYERFDESVEFPNGDYLFPAPQAQACALGFKLVEHHHLPLNRDDRRLSTKILKFCQKEGIGSNNATFPRGNYCVLTTNDKCPSSQFTIENILIVPFYHFRDKFSRYLACCQKDTKLISNIAIPKVPFALYSSSSCSYVDGFPAIWQSEEDTILVQPSGLERPPFNQAQKKLRICKYDQIRSWTVERKCQCHPNARCDLFLKDNNCQCLPGFFGDGKTICAKITNETDKCSNLCNGQFSVCSKSSSDGHSCICKEGYEGNGFKCIPSCKTRNCQAFSQCIINEKESHCMCNPSTIEVDNGRCHRDLINTVHYLSGFHYLSQMNLSCFSKEAYDHLVDPKENRILFLFFPTNKDVFCDLAHNYYGFTRKQQFRPNIPLRIAINTSRDNSILVTKSEDNEWMVANKFKAIKTDLFTNAVVLYLNGTEISSIFSHLAPSYLRQSQSKAITGFDFVVWGVLLLILVIMLLVIIDCKRKTFIFGKASERGRDANIHFITADDKIEMES